MTRLQRTYMDVRCPSVMLRLLVATMGLSSACLAQPPRQSGPRFAVETELGTVHVTEVARVRDFGKAQGARWAGWGPIAREIEAGRPFLRLLLRVDCLPGLFPRALAVRQAVDDTGASLVPTHNDTDPPTGAPPPGTAIQLDGAAIWDRTTREVDGQRRSVAERGLGLLAPSPEAKSLSLALSIPYPAVAKWEETEFRPAEAGKGQGKEQGWARLTLDSYSTAPKFGDTPVSGFEAVVRLRRLSGTPGIPPDLFQFSARGAKGRAVPSSVAFPRLGDDGQSVVFTAKWMGAPANFEPTAITVRFPSSVETKTAEVRFSSVPLP